MAGNHPRGEDVLITMANDQVYYYKAWLEFHGDRTMPFPPGHRVIKVISHPDDDLFNRSIRVLVEAPAVVTGTGEVETRTPPRPSAPRPAGDNLEDAFRETWQ